MRQANGRQRLGMFIANIVNMVQPVIDQPKALAEQRGAHTAATVMPHHHDVFDFQYIDSKLDNRQTIKIGVHHHIGDIAMHEHLTRHQPDNFIGGYSTIRAANPEKFWVLLFSELLKKIRMLGKNTVGPGTIFLKQGVEINVAKGHGFTAFRSMSR